MKSISKTKQSNLLRHFLTVVLSLPFDADYVGYTARHRHQRIAEHKNSAIGRHYIS